MEDNPGMMTFIYRYMKFLALVFLPAIIWLFTNATINTHTHILDDGVRITHAHPFDKNTGKTNSFPTHKHTRGELNIISHPLTLLTFTLIILISSGRDKIIFKPYILHYFSREHYYVFNYHAPPGSFL